MKWDGCLGSVEGYNARVFVGSIEDGNGVEVTACIEDGVVRDMKARTYGCRSLLASALGLVMEARGRPIAEIMGNLSHQETRGGAFVSGCSVDKNSLLCMLLSPGGQVLPSWNPLLCRCKQLRRNDVENRILVDGLLTYTQVARVFGLDPVCSVCRNRIVKVLKRVIETEKMIRFGVTDYEG